MQSYITSNFRSDILVGVCELHITEKGIRRELLPLLNVVSKLSARNPEITSTGC